MSRQNPEVQQPARRQENNRRKNQGHHEGNLRLTGGLPPERAGTGNEQRAYHSRIKQQGKDKREKHTELAGAHFEPAGTESAESEKFINDNGKITQIRRGNRGSARTKLDGPEIISGEHGEEAERDEAKPRVR